MMARERYDDGTDSIKLGKEACEACRVPAAKSKVPWLNNCVECCARRKFCR